MLRRKPVHYAEQNHRIQPAGNRDKNRFSAAKELTALDGLSDVLKKITHRSKGTGNVKQCKTESATKSESSES